MGGHTGTREKGVAAALSITPRLARQLGMRKRDQLAGCCKAGTKDIPLGPGWIGGTDNDGEFPLPLSIFYRSSAYMKQWLQYQDDHL
jgi:hypothetical protein